LATRVPDTEDGRVVTVRLTDEGRRRHTLVADRRTAILTTILTPFDQTDRDALAGLLDRFLASLERYVCDGAPL
jgi:DNA-binding MarR family transcriptional regulator